MYDLPRFELTWVAAAVAYCADVYFAFPFKKNVSSAACVTEIYQACKLDVTSAHLDIW